MNEIHLEKYLLALEYAIKGESVRNIAKLAGISKETAHRLQKWVKMVIWESGGKNEILTGKKGSGEKSKIVTDDFRESWNRKSDKGDYEKRKIFPEHHTLMERIWGNNGGNTSE